MFISGYSFDHLEGLIRNLFDSEALNPFTIFCPVVNNRLKTSGILLELYVYAKTGQRHFKLPLQLSLWFYYLCPALLKPPTSNA
jgi:hypothetical protein